MRNSGTLGGNVANGSPIGDSMPLLIALGANVVLMSQRDGRQLLTANCRWSSSTPATARTSWPRTRCWPGSRCRGQCRASSQRVYKISKRFEDDISAVCLAMQLQRRRRAQSQSASIGAGGVAATPVRAAKTEAALRRPDAGNADFRCSASAVLRAEFEPISDMRASAAYRREVLGNLLQRFWLESQGLPNVSP